MSMCLFDLSNSRILITPSINIILLETSPPSYFVVQFWHHMHETKKRWEGQVCPSTCFMPKITQNICIKSDIFGLYYYLILVHTGQM
jgi:hypothetical protein